MDHLFGVWVSREPGVPASPPSGTESSGEIPNSGEHCKAASTATYSRIPVASVSRNAIRWPFLSRLTPVFSQ